MVLKQHYRPRAISGAWVRVGGFLLAAAVALLGVPAGAGEVEFTGPGLITSVGQSSDIAVVKVLLNTKLKLGLDVDPLADGAKVDGLKTLIVVVGASTKGLGAAGVDYEKEAARAKELLRAARSHGVKILAMHTGGESRRGKTTDDLISLVVPEADFVVVVASGNQDGIFQRLAKARGTEVVEVESLVAAGDAVRAVFKE
jgi:hypothetical protein